MNTSVATRRYASLHQAETKMSSLASHNHIVRSYFDIARKTAHEVVNSTLENDKCSKSAVTILMSVAAVEAYINIFGRMWVEQIPGFVHAKKILDDLKNRKFITYKIRTWPKFFFGKNLDLAHGGGRDFLELIEKRNYLLHFTSDYHTLQFENVTIKGLVDSTVFDSLTAADAVDAICKAEGFIEAWIRLQRLEEYNVVNATASWTGKM